MARNRAEAQVRRERLALQDEESLSAIEGAENDPSAYERRVWFVKSDDAVRALDRKSPADQDNVVELWPARDAGVGLARDIRSRTTAEAPDDLPVASSAGSEAGPTRIAAVGDSTAERVRFERAICSLAEDELVERQTHRALIVRERTILLGMCVTLSAAAVVAALAGLAGETPIGALAIMSAVLLRRSQLR